MLKSGFIIRTSTAHPIESRRFCTGSWQPQWHCSVKMNGQRDWYRRWPCSQQHEIARFLIRATGSQTASLYGTAHIRNSLPLLAISRMVCDMLMTCFLSMAMIFFYEWMPHTPPPRLDGAGGGGSEKDASLRYPPSLALPLKGRGGKLLYSFYVCLALAVMAKGFVAIILAGDRLQYSYYGSAPRGAHGCNHCQQAASCYSRASSRRGTSPHRWRELGFAYFYFVNEHVLRFLNMREPHDYYNYVSGITSCASRLT